MEIVLVQMASHVYERENCVVDMNTLNIVCPDRRKRYITYQNITLRYSTGIIFRDQSISFTSYSCKQIILKKLGTIASGFRVKNGEWKVYISMLTLSSKPQIWWFHVVVVQSTARICAKMRAHVQHDYFSSFNQWWYSQCFAALSLTSR